MFILINRFSINLYHFNYNQISSKINLQLANLFYNIHINLYKYTLNILYLKHKKLKAIFLFLQNIYNILSIGFYMELLLIGLGYKITRIGKNKIKFDLNYSHKIIYINIVDIIIRCFKKRILIFGIQKLTLMNIATKLRSLRIPNVYKGTGIRFKNENVKLKIGKKK